MIWKKATEIPVLSSKPHLLVVYGTRPPAGSTILSPVLTKEEWAHANRIKSSGQKDTWISCRTVLKSMLASYLNLPPTKIELKKNSFGKPYLAHSNLFFNVSHTEDSFLLGFSIGGEIGIDLERLSGDEDLTSLIDYAFSPTETNYYFQSGLSKHFLEIWTLKEAYLKAIGIGLVGELKSINVSGDINNDISQKKFHRTTFTCPRGEIASLVYPNDQLIKYIWLR